MIDDRFEAGLVTLLALHGIDKQIGERPEIVAKFVVLMLMQLIATKQEIDTFMENIMEDNRNDDSSEGTNG
jgi:hypothetical protein